MNIDGDIAKKLLEAMNKVTVGGYLEFHSPMPGLCEENVVVQLIARTEKRWDFDMLWFDIPFAKASARIVGSELLFEVEK